jgi:hypothetical protein
VKERDGESGLWSGFVNGVFTCFLDILDVVKFFVFRDFLW